MIDPGQAFGTGAPREHAPVPGAAAGAGRERAADGAAAGRRHRLGRARDRRRHARLRARARPRPRAGERRRPRARTRPSTASRSRSAASTCAPESLPWLGAGESIAGAAGRAREPAAPAAARARRHDARAPAHLIAGGLLHEEVDEVATAFAAPSGAARARAPARGGEWAAVWLHRGLIVVCSGRRPGSPWRRATIERYTRSIAGRTPSSLCSSAPAALSAAPIVSSASPTSRVRGRGRRRSPCRASPAPARSRRRTAPGRQGSRSRTRAPGAPTARSRARAATGPTAGSALAIEQRRHRAAEHRPRGRLVEAGLRGDAQRHVERRRRQAVGRIGGEHDPLGRHAREQLDHVQREEARDVVEHARVVGQARGEDPLVADRAVGQDQHRAGMAQREIRRARPPAAAGRGRRGSGSAPPPLRPARRPRPSRARRRRSPARAGAA